MAEASALTGSLGLGDSEELPKLQQSAKEEAGVEGTRDNSVAKNNKPDLTDSKSEGDEPAIVDQKPDNSTDPAEGSDAHAKDARSSASLGAGMRASPKSDALAMQSIANIKVKVQAILGGIQMPVSQLANIKQGELISLDSNVGEAIDIVANGQLIARGEIVVIEEGVPRFGITLTEVI